MMRWLLLGSLALAGLLAGGVALAHDGGRDGLTKPMVLRFLDVSVNEEFLDVEPKGTEVPSPGDTAFFDNVLRNLADTETKGTFDGKCTFLIGGMADCRGHVVLPGGKIELGGGIDFSTGPTSFEAAVLGGTGRYDNVVGEATITQIAEGRSRLVLELIPSFRRP
jgi:hypothetical protein